MLTDVESTEESVKICSDSISGALNFCEAPRFWISVPSDLLL